MNVILAHGALEEATDRSKRNLPVDPDPPRVLTRGTEGQRQAVPPLGPRDRGRWREPWGPALRPAPCREGFPPQALWEWAPEKRDRKRAAGRRCLRQPRKGSSNKPTGKLQHKPAYFRPRMERQLGKMEGEEEGMTSRTLDGRAEISRPGGGGEREGGRALPSA